MIAHTKAFVTSAVEHWLDREISQWFHHEGSIRQPTATMYLIYLLTRPIESAACRKAILESPTGERLLHV